MIQLLSVFDRSWKHKRAASRGYPANLTKASRFTPNPDSGSCDYEAGRPCFCQRRDFHDINDEIDDAEWLTGLISLTEQELPLPKPRNKKK
jgi:hypothetical protein